jgi:benzoylformate decarboxylase
VTSTDTNTASGVRPAGDAGGRLGGTPSIGSVRDATIAVLRQRSMTTVFGNPGSTELGLLRDFPDDLRYVLALHEGVAVAIADGYAQATDRPAFVNLHSACGVGNAMGAVVNAFHNRAPLVICAGNQDRRHLESEPYLFARSVELAVPYVKRASEPARAQDVPAALDRAWVLAATPPRGPVFVSVPSDDWDAPIDEPPRVGESFTAGDVSPSGLDRVAARLRDARAPGIVAGAGIDRYPDARRAVQALAEWVRAPVWTAPQAPRLGFDEAHPQYRGHLPPGRAGTAAALAGCDLVLVLGAPAFAFLPYQPSEHPLPPLILVTDDPNESARSGAAIAVVGDVRAVADGLTQRVARRDSAAVAVARPAPVAAAPSRAAPAAPIAVPAADGSSAITADELMVTLAAALSDDAVLVEESPSSRPQFRAHVHIRRPASFYASASGGLGFAMGAAVGIKLADPSRPVVCLVGDGSALYVPQALWSAVQLGTAVAFVVVNNGRYGILESAASFAGIGGLPSMALPGIDFSALAAAFGCRAIRVEDRRDVAPALADAATTSEPLLVDVAIDPTPLPLF